MGVALIFSLVFALILILLVAGEYHRSVVALFGALLTILFGLEFGLFDIQDLWSELVSFVDLNAVLLVVGVMILSETIARSGFFEFISLSFARAVGVGIRRIYVSFIFLTVLFSALLSNITAMVIIGALTVSLLKKLDVDPTGIVLYEAVMTNVGGLMFMISSIPNLIVAAELKIGFIEFAVVSIPLTLILSLSSTLYILHKIEGDPSQEKHVEVDPWSVVENKGLFYRAMAVFLCVVALFVFEDFLKIPLGLIAIGGAIVMLVLGGQDPESIFSRMDWGTVFFLTSFYIIVGGLERSGVLTAFAKDVTRILSFQPSLASLLNVWICGLSSSVVDNIPMTLTLIPVMKQISDATGFPISTLAWGIVFGANLGGNLTPIGSPSNIIALGMLRREGKSVGWDEWISRCVPLVTLQLLLASLYVILLIVIL